jgi:hypothetical protein
MNTPHPMLYPIHDLPPEEMAKQHSDINMQKAYRILWDNTLSYFAKRPLVREHRIIFGWEDLRFASLQVEVIGPGWLRFQELSKEAPQTSIPIAGTWESPPSGATLQDLNVCIQEQPEGVATDAMIAWLADNRIASPGNLSQILAQLEGAGWIDRDQNGQITLRSAGKELLDAARSAELRTSVDALASFRAVLEKLDAGQVALSQAADMAFEAIGLHFDESLAWMDTVGVPQEASGTEGNSTNQTFLSNDLGYPAAIDPNLLLPPEAPERVARFQREMRLQDHWGERWGWFSQRERAVLRLAEKIREMDAKNRATEMAMQTCFDVLVRWEIILSAQEHAISAEEITSHLQQ